MKKMKAYIKPLESSWALEKVIHALTRYAPDSVEIVNDQNEANLVILHIIGRQDRTRRQAINIKRSRKRYAVIQYSLRSTMRPSTEGWFPLWQGAALTWSYYNLKALCVEDGTSTDFPFYCAPLGVDTTIFYPRYYQERQHVIGSSGPSWLTESVREATLAASSMGRSVFHLGPEKRRSSNVMYASGIEDDALADLLSQCEFVAGLRRTEGFELLAAEGLLCGARPICFDRTHYRQWFDPWAIFIPEGSRKRVVDSLEAIFRSRIPPITDAEIATAEKLFDWKTIIEGFWSRLWNL